MSCARRARTRRPGARGVVLTALLCNIRGRPVLDALTVQPEKHRRKSGALRTPPVLSARQASTNTLLKARGPMRRMRTRGLAALHARVVPQEPISLTTGAPRAFFVRTEKPATRRKIPHPRPLVALCIANRALSRQALIHDSGFPVSQCHPTIGNLTSILTYGGNAASHVPQESFPQRMHTTTRLTSSGCTLVLYPTATT